MRRFALGAALTLAALTLTALVVPAAAATAAPISSCTSSAGTIVAVDFAHWGGPVVRGCDTGNPKRGIDLLADEGFTTAGDDRDGPQFVCRIGNNAFAGGTQYPTPAQDPCVVTPPASAYWSYWLAPAGQDTWSYDQEGAYSDVPKPGEVELWIFGGTNVGGTQGRPACAPATLRAGGTAAHCSPAATGESPAPAPISRRSSSSASRGTGRGVVAHSPARSPAATGSTGRSGPGSGRRSVSAPAGQPASSPGVRTHPATAGISAAQPGSPSAGAVTVDAGQAGQIVTARKAPASAPSAGSPVPVIVGVGLALILVAGGGCTVWRRRQSE